MSVAVEAGPSDAITDFLFDSHPIQVVEAPDGRQLDEVEQEPIFRDRILSREVPVQAQGKPGGLVLEEIAAKLEVPHAVRFSSKRDAASMSEAQAQATRARDRVPILVR
ncbi:MAG: hypothetical protein ACXVEF_42055 [Polyangiales bacterium]